MNRSYYEWKMKSVLYKASTVECTCTWNSYEDCITRDCPRAVQALREFERIETSRRQEIIARAERDGGPEPVNVEVMQGDWFRAEGLIVRPDQSVVMEVTGDISDEAINTFIEAWKKQLNGVHCVIVRKDELHIAGVKDVG